MIEGASENYFWKPATSVHERLPLSRIAPQTRSRRGAGRARGPVRPGLGLHDWRSAGHDRYRRLRLRGHEDVRAGHASLVARATRPAVPDVGRDDGGDDGPFGRADGPGLRGSQPPTAGTGAAVRAGWNFPRR